MVANPPILPALVGAAGRALFGHPGRPRPAGIRQPVWDQQGGRAGTSLAAGGVHRAGPVGMKKPPAGGKRYQWGCG
jgi:hypothetical protein